MFFKKSLPFCPNFTKCNIDKSTLVRYNKMEVELKYGSGVMSDKLSPEKNLSFSINNSLQHSDIARLGKALSSLERLSILELLQSEPKYLIEIAETINIPLSSVSRHVDVLAEAGLIFISFDPGPKGHSKLCSKAILNANISFEDVVKNSEANTGFITEMPIGMYTDCSITAPCGMASTNASIGDFDNPSVFFSAKRADAELIWFNTGSVTYKLPVKLPKPESYKEMTVSFEVCSETVYHRNKWPSDITVIINDIEINTFTSPGDFGGRRGKFTPEYWPIISTQYGLLMKFTVSADGVFVNNVLKNDTIKIADLNLTDNDFIKLTLAIKDDAVHKGGINLFGKGFGDYPQAIIMTIR